MHMHTCTCTCRYDALLSEKQSVERALLDEQHEKLKVAKALVDLQVHIRMDIHMHIDEQHEKLKVAKALVDLQARLGDRVVYEGYHRLS